MQCSGKAAGVSIAIASIGELLVEFVCSDKGGGHRRIGTYTGPYPSGAPGIFIDQAARSRRPFDFCGLSGAPMLSARSSWSVFGPTALTTA